MSNHLNLTIGLYGGLANNLYLLSKALYACGHNVIFIRERDIAYALSQPVWEDVEFTISIKEMANVASYSNDKWTEIENRLQWKAPAWLWDPLGHATSCEEYSRLKSLNLGFSPNDAAIMRKMQECNLLITTGIKASILAHESGVPYIIQPHGGDMMAAAGLQRVAKCRNIIELLFGNRWERAVRKAFNNAKAVGVHNKNINQLKPIKKPVLPFRRKKIDTRLSELATYTHIHEPLKSDARRRLLYELSCKLNFNIPPDDRHVIFIPSRVDFFWKGQDRLFKALENPILKSKYHFIFSGWGDDLEVMKDQCALLGCSTTFLDFVLSKPLLYKLMAASDLVIDNFVSGHYGTSGVEAMGRGTPLLMWCDPVQYGGNDYLPPVLQARTTEDIEEVLLYCCSGKIDMERAQVAAYNWAKKHHSEQAIESQIMHIIETDIRS